MIPQIRKAASHVYSYQRTRAWTVIRDQFSYPRIIKFIFRWLPFLMRLYRVLLFLQVMYITFERQLNSNNNNNNLASFFEITKCPGGGERIYIII